jgi:hypothetical protein
MSEDHNMAAEMIGNDSTSYLLHICCIFWFIQNLIYFSCVGNYMYKLIETVSKLFLEPTSTEQWMYSILLTEAMPLTRFEFMQLVIISTKC